MPGGWGMTPRQSVTAECERRGQDAALAAAAVLQDDPVPRVRAAASRAVMLLSSDGA